MILAIEPIKFMLYGVITTNTTDWDEIGLCQGSDFKRIKNFLDPFMFRQVTMSVFLDGDPDQPLVACRGIVDYEHGTRIVRHARYNFCVGEYSLGELEEVLKEHEGAQCDMRIKLDPSEDAISFYGKLGLLRTKPRQKLGGYFLSLKNGRNGMMLKDNTQLSSMLGERMIINAWSQHAHRLHCQADLIAPAKWDQDITIRNAFYEKGKADKLDHKRLYVLLNNEGFVHKENTTLCIRKPPENDIRS